MFHCNGFSISGLLEIRYFHTLSAVPYSISVFHRKQTNRIKDGVFTWKRTNKQQWKWISTDHSSAMQNNPLLAVVCEWNLCAEGVFVMLMIWLCLAAMLLPSSGRRHERGIANNCFPRKTFFDHPEGNAKEHLLGNQLEMTMLTKAF